MPGVASPSATWAQQLSDTRAALLAQGMDAATADRVVADYAQRIGNDAFAAFQRLGEATRQPGTPITHDQELAATRLVTLIGELGQLARDQGVTLAPQEQTLVRQSACVRGTACDARDHGCHRRRRGLLAARRTQGATKPTGEVGGRPVGQPETVRANTGPEQKRGIRLQNEAAETLAKAGYRVEHNPQSNVVGSNNRDVYVEGRRFDICSPEGSTSPGNIVAAMSGKPTRNQTDRVVLNLANNPVSRHELRAAFAAGNSGIKQVIVIGPDKTIYRLP
jgi:hypothetical protein